MTYQPAGDEEFVYTFHNDLPAGQVEGFRQLQVDLDQAAKHFDGYLGQELLYEPHQADELTHCTARIRFTSLERCLAWLDSSERRRLLVDAETSIGYRYSSMVEPQSFDQWIAVRSGQHTPTWKVNLLVWLALYPSVMILILTGQTTLGRLPLPLNMLISNAITVAVTGWWLVPWLSRVYKGWLSNRSQRWNWIHGTTILGFLMLFLLAFSTIHLK